MEYGETYEEQDLLQRRGSEGGSSDGRSSAELEALVQHAYKAYSYASISRSKWRILSGWRVSRSRRLWLDSWRIIAAFEYSRPRRKRSLRGSLCSPLLHSLYLIVILLVVFGVWFPSYCNPPQRYTDLRLRVEQSSAEGAANVNNEKMFIAASLDDLNGDLVSGHWGQSVLRLIQILGPENVFLSVYENDASEESRAALTNFRDSVPCESSIVHEHLDQSQLPHMTMPDGSLGLKRIAFLSEVRNRALRPLDDPNSTASNTQWDKLLYLNDIAFDPIDAANLLLNTHIDETTGRTDYRAACAVDFIMPFKFYDTFATRDFEGYKMGTPFYPWFTNSGHGQSRRDVLSQTDAVRVKSCWGGMAAFEAKWFQSHPSVGDAYREIQHANAIDSPPSNNTSLEVQSMPPPLRFRFESDTYWDASECCLVHADIAQRLAEINDGQSLDEPGVYINPYIRVAYSQTTLNWLPFTKRFERLYPPIHLLADWIGQVPKHNPRRLQQAGDEVIDRVWQWDESSLQIMSSGTVEDLQAGLHGAFVDSRRVAQAGQFCGNRKLLYIKPDRQNGDQSWDEFKVPPGWRDW